MKRVSLLVLLGTIGLIIALIACAAPVTPPPEDGEEAPPPEEEAPPPAEEVFKWDMNYPLYRGTWDWDVLVRWCDDLRVASEGRLDITPYSAGEIMPGLETFDAVSTGTLKIDFTYGPYWTGKLPMAIYASGTPPFTLPRWEQYKVLYYKLGLEELLREAYAEHNIYFVAAMPTDCGVVMSKSPIRKAADFEGKKLRATGIYAEVATLAGAACPYFPWGEIYGALEKGTIDGVMMGGGIGVLCDAGFHEATSYFLETPITPVDAWSLHVNMDAWNELPPDLQMLLYESTSYAGDLFTASYFGWDAVWTEKVVEEWGFTITSLSEEEQAIIREYTMEVLDKYSAEDPVYFAEATEILKDYMKSLGLLE